MKFTNRGNLPEAVVQAVTNDTYKKGDADFTVTEILRPPRQRALMKRHADELEEDVSDRLWALYGQMGHTLLERAGMPNDITEVRYKAKFGNWWLSAQMDSVAVMKRVLTDWKFTTAFKFMAGKLPPADYVWQLNIQKRILDRQPEPIQVDQLQIGGMLRDWQISKADKDRRYPQTPICIMPIRVLPAEQVDVFVLNSIESHLAAENGDLPRCTEEETWQGRRCRDYCSVKKFCDQAKEAGIK